MNYTMIIKLNLALFFLGAAIAACIVDTFLAFPDMFCQAIIFISSIADTWTKESAKTDFWTQLQIDFGLIEEPTKPNIWTLLQQDWVPVLVVFILIIAVAVLLWKSVCYVSATLSGLTFDMSDYPSENRQDLFAANAAAAKIQAFARIRTIAAKIEAIAREMIDTRERNAAATKIQAIARMMIAIREKKSAIDTRNKNAAADKIQAFARIMTVAAKIEAIAREMKRNATATKIQAIARMMIAIRKKKRAILEKKKEARTKEVKKNEEKVEAQMALDEATNTTVSESSDDQSTEKYDILDDDKMKQALERFGYKEASELSMGDLDDRMVELLIDKPEEAEELEDFYKRLEDFYKRLKAEYEDIWRLPVSNLAVDAPKDEEHQPPVSALSNLAVDAPKDDEQPAPVLTPTVDPYLKAGDDIEKEMEKTWSEIFALQEDEVSELTNAMDWQPQPGPIELEPPDYAGIPPVGPPSMPILPIHQMKVFERRLSQFKKTVDGEEGRSHRDQTTSRIRETKKSARLAKRRQMPSVGPPSKPIQQMKVFERRLSEFKKPVDGEEGRFHRKETTYWIRERKKSAQLAKRRQMRTC